MSDFLDKLVREVSEWSAVGFHKAGMEGNDFLALESESWKEDWLQRRKELINEPDDSDAPEWANWKAQDSNGIWLWYGVKPEPGEKEWKRKDSFWQYANLGENPAGHDWRTTLKEVNQMDNLKEVKLAWANGEQVQRIINTDNGEKWVDWRYSSYLDIESGHDWRVKPKYKTVKQWERKYYYPADGMVYTAVSYKPKADWDSDYSAIKWITEQYLVEYEVPERSTSLG